MMWRLLVVASLAALSQAFYLPGVAPKDYKAGDKVEVHVNALSSALTVRLFRIAYRGRLCGAAFLHFCAPDSGPKSQGESLGSILFGDRLYDSRFSIAMKQNKTCEELCKSSQKVPSEDAKFINERIREHYIYNWVVDGLPAGVQVPDKNRKNVFYYLTGFSLGILKETTEKTVTPFLNNHFDLHISYHTTDKHKTHHRVVGVLVRPYSIADKNDCRAATDPTSGKTDYAHLHLSEQEKAETDVTYTYSVYWTNYLSMNMTASEPRIHWFSLINSVVIVLFLSGMVAMILLRALHKDIARYNQLDSEDAQEDFGWKLVHGDVFRPPSFPNLFSVLVGSGAQIFYMSLVTLIFAVLGFLSPSSRGSLTTVMLVFYVVFGSFAGYYSARLYKMFGGESWKQKCYIHRLFLPWSSGAVPFGSMLALIALWFLISAPLCFIGAYFGFKKAVQNRNPVRTNQIPRQIPEQAFYLKPIPAILMGGILPFGAIFIELYFIMNSIWTHKIYYVFGFLFIVFLILIITCSEVTILMCYFHLWWRSFLTSGASALYVFLYGIIYYATRLEIHSAASTVLYFGWTFVMSLVFFVLTGTIGFVACFFFIRKIYSSIKSVFASAALFSTITLLFLTIIFHFPVDMAVWSWSFPCANGFLFAL
ncbi:Endomembrane protein 70-domain-containing protein [Chytridium lagenaria]|nr:Endomembrane protein 70-domain-containing protein [Chytridium lagenaria]